MLKYLSQDHGVHQNLQVRLLSPDGDTIAAIIAVSTAATGGPSQLQAQVGPQAPFSETEFQRFDHSVVPAETNLRSNLFFKEENLIGRDLESSGIGGDREGSCSVEHE